MYKAIFIDIDGTLRDDNKIISERTKNVIKKATENGVLIVLCSGRPQKYTENISRECGASRYIITASGGNIYDYEDEKTIYINKMNKKACVELYKIAEKAGVRFGMYVGDRIVTNKIKYENGLEIKLDEPIKSFMEMNDVFQCNIADKDYNKMKDIVPYIEKVENCEIKNRHKSLNDINEPKIGDIYLDVADASSCKGDAVRRFCEILNIDLKDTIAIGDDYNDLSMFKVVGHSVAMGNANDMIKNAADEVTNSNNENGVAVFLEKII